MNFTTRLKDFRIKKGFSSKRDFANELGINENSYYMFENGSRNPSKKFLAKLSLYSDLPEEYWLYGAKTDNELCNSREEFKMLHCVMERLKDSYKKEEDFTPDQKELILLAFKADMMHIIEKEKTPKKEQDD